MRTSFRRALSEGPVLLDGGLATALEAAGADLADPLWSAKLLLDDPEAIVTAHRSFVDAGAQVLTTASYQASLPGLRARGLTDAAALQYIEQATALARRAATELQWVAASAGPYGAYLADGSEYRGHYGVALDDLVEFHAERLPAYRTADVVAFETVPCRLEAEAIARACASLPEGLDAWESFSAADDAHASSGEPIEACIEAALSSPRVLAVGVNCCAPQDVLGLLRRIRTVTDVPLVAYPNAGRRYDAGAWHGAPISPSDMREHAAAWTDAGARLLGGCCQIGAAHLRTLHRAIAHGSR
ncbi:MAG: homocysteine S-methyltransferase [Nannocystaceae bacterium]|nr:homocysteine S-methyltransferase [bacterium]